MQPLSREGGFLLTCSQEPDHNSKALKLLTETAPTDFGGCGVRARRRKNWTFFQFGNSSPSLVFHQLELCVRHVGEIYLNGAETDEGFDSPSISRKQTGVCNEAYRKPQTIPIDLAGLAFARRDFSPGAA